MGTVLAAPVVADRSAAGHVGSERPEALEHGVIQGPILMAGCSEDVAKDPQEAVNTFSYGDCWTPYLAQTAPPAIQKQIGQYIAAMTASGNPNTTDYGQLGVMDFAAFPDLQYALQQASPPTLRRRSTPPCTT